jgi:large subunit ribosomal protein L31
MKPGIHPNYVEATVICSCGNTFTTRSTKKELRTDLCNVCHPFYTGEQRIVDTAGQVERFTNRMKAAEAAAGSKSKRQRLLLEPARIRAAAEAEAKVAAEAAAAEERARRRAEREAAAAEAAAQAEAEPAAEAPAEEASEN